MFIVTKNNEIFEALTEFPYRWPLIETVENEDGYLISQDKGAQ